MVQRCFKHDGPYELSSGLTSKYYYDGKLATLHPPTAWLIGTVMVDVILASGAEAVGGTAVGSIPMSDAIGIAAHLRGRVLPTFYVRRETKGHGTQSQVAQARFNGEELLVPGRRVAIVDDVITTGGSLRAAIDAVEQLGCEVTVVAALVERHESAGKALRGARYPVLRVFYTDENGRLFIDEEFARQAEHAAAAALSGRSSG